MNYATWKLRAVDESYLDGPESVIVEKGGTAKAIYASGDVTKNGIVLGLVSGDVSGLDDWNFTTLSRAEAEAFIEANFVEPQESDARQVTLQDALKSLD
jgi:hypothetical protein